jgi:hypothetical protein
LTGLPYERIALLAGGKLLSLAFGGFRLLVPLLFDRDLTHGSLPDVLKAGWLDEIDAPNKLAKSVPGSSQKSNQATAIFKLATKGETGSALASSVCPLVYTTQINPPRKSN